MITSSTTPTVDAVGTMHFEGNIIPHTWYSTITTQTPKGIVKPDLLGIVILSDIVYWYRPTEVRDEATGHIIGFHKKFEADKLQRSYTSLAEQFGVPKRHVKEALDRLKARGIITMEFRTITTGTGLVLTNVLFLDLNPDLLATYTFPCLTQVADGIPPLPRKTVPPPHEKPYHPPTKNRTTYTKSTTEISTESLAPEVHCTSGGNGFPSRKQQSEKSREQAHAPPPIKEHRRSTPVPLGDLLMEVV